MKPILTLTGRIIASFAMILIIQLVASMIFPEDRQLYFPSIALATICMLWLFSKDQIHHGLDQVNSFRKHGFGFILGILLITLSFVAIWLFRGVKIEGVTFDASTLSSLFSTTALFFIVSFQEELFFRGYLHSLTENLFNQRAALIVTSILFSITHALNPGAFANPLPLLNILLAGLLLGFLRAYSNGIWLPIGFHWSWNLFQGTFFGFHVSGISIHSIAKTQPMGNAYISGGDFGAEGSILTSLVLLVSILLLFQYQKKRSMTQHS